MKKQQKLSLEDFKKTIPKIKTTTLLQQITGGNSESCHVSSEDEEAFAEMDLESLLNAG